MLKPEKEYYLSYWVHFEDGFDFDGPVHSGGKLPGLGGAGGTCSGGQTCDGNNGFTSRYMWRKNGAAVLYLYHMDKKSKYPEDIPLVGSDGLQKSFIPGKWHRMIQRVRINDNGQSNGEVDVWMDGDKVASVKNLRFVTNGGLVDRFFFSSFHGGSGKDWLPEKHVNAYFDDIEITTDPVHLGFQ